VRRALVFLILLSASAAVAAAAELTLKPIDQAGYRALLKRHAGKVIIMDIWAAWCEPCRDEMPQLARLQKQLASRGVDYVTVTLDSPGELSYAEKFLRKNLVPFPAYYRKTKDEDDWVRNVSPQWTGTLPALFLYDRRGNLAKTFIGGQPPGTIDAAVLELLKN
jgi:thiol-disulfide isomerase/thioredoxin